MKINKLALILIFAFQHMIVAQNLIPNGSFEEYTTDKNPYAPRLLKNLRGGWEYFSTARTSYRPNILTLSRSGQKRKVWPNGVSVLEYYNYQSVTRDALTKTIFQVPLQEKLKKDALYRFSFYIHLVQSFKNSIADTIADPNIVQFFVRDSIIKEVNEISYLKDEKTIGRLPTNRSYEMYHNDFWTFNAIDFQANGNENYLVFGTIDTAYTDSWLVIWFDDLRLYLIDDTVSIFKNTEVGNSIVIEDILFETNNSVLQVASYKMLNKIAAEMKANSFKIEISGHTDNKGNDRNNMKLSRERAKSVVEYLVERGVDPCRLKFKGVGSTRPIADNETEKGRRRNRRVELMIIGK